MLAVLLGCQSSFFFIAPSYTSDIKEIFKEQQASHIDADGNFVLVSSLHRSLVANRVEGMKKLQKKVNHAYITKRRKEGATGRFLFSKCG